MADDALIKRMVDRFLAWRLPEDFNPDAGISYDPATHSPTGTNLFDARQAEAMVRHMLEGLPEDPAPRLADALRDVLMICSGYLRLQSDGLPHLEEARVALRVYDAPPPAEAKQELSGTFQCHTCFLSVPHSASAHEKSPRGHRAWMRVYREEFRRENPATCLSCFGDRTVPNVDPVQLRDDPREIPCPGCDGTGVVKGASPTPTEGEE